jgi:hypothetical protein
MFCYIFGSRKCLSIEAVPIAPVSTGVTECNCYPMPEKLIIVSNKLQNVVFQVVMLCSLVDGYLCFRVTLLP